MSRLRTKRAAVDLTGELREGVTLSGSPTITVSPSGPTMGTGTVNVADIDIDGTTVAIGKAITFLITGGVLVAAGRYIISVSCGTTDSENVGIDCILDLE